MKKNYVSTFENFEPMTKIDDFIVTGIPSCEPLILNKAQLDHLTELGLILSNSLSEHFFKDSDLEVIHRELNYGSQPAVLSESIGDIPGGIDKDVIVHGHLSFNSGRPIYDYVYKSSSVGKKMKYEAMGKKLYIVNNKDLKIVEAGKSGKEEFAYYLNPELVDKLNVIGEQTNEVIKLKKELFASVVYHSAIGDKSALTLQKQI